ncbi:MAG: hypothetical protein AAF211_16610, partial [Myxococcota bacterium]
ARSQILPRWPTSPLATRVFLEVLTRVFETGVPVGLAVEQARAHLRERFEDAGVWASFGLSGDPTVRIG